MENQDKIVGAFNSARPKQASVPSHYKHRPVAKALQKHLQELLCV
jgi:hypothetical protein